jgi:hypothetical protein
MTTAVMIDLPDSMPGPYQNPRVPRTEGLRRSVAGSRRKLPGLPVFAGNARRHRQVMAPMNPLPLLACLAAAACTTGTPLTESSPQIELTANPGQVAGKPALALTLTTWNHLAALGDAVDGHQLSATLNGAPLTMDPTATGYFGNGDRYVAAFAETSCPHTASSALAISDGQTTWSFHVLDLMTNDLVPTAPLVAGQPAQIEWPSAANATQPVSTIDWACIQVAGRTAACTGNGAADPGIAIVLQRITTDVAANPGDPYVITAARVLTATSTGDGNDVFVTVLDQTTGTFH